MAVMLHMPPVGDTQHGKLMAMGDLIQQPHIRKLLLAKGRVHPGLDLTSPGLEQHPTQASAEATLSHVQKQFLQKDGRRPSAI